MSFRAFSSCNIPLTERLPRLVRKERTGQRYSLQTILGPWSRNRLAAGCPSERIRPPTPTLPQAPTPPISPPSPPSTPTPPPAPPPPQRGTFNPSTPPAT